jgi:2-desacetyl-2-hydroxyethyl bacteriochlorophyllide A dehydrogenase
MRAVVLQEPGRFHFDDARPFQPTPGHAVVRVRSVGICGSDIHAYHGRQPFFSFPRIIGHELGVEVVSVPGSNEESDIQPGDRCAIEPYLFCKKCPVCLAGRTNCCESLQVLGIHTDGGLCEYLSVPIDKLHRSSKLSFEQLALIETLGIGHHAVARAGVQIFESVLVVGAGPIGLAVAQCAQIAGGNVTICDVNTTRRAFADRFGIPAVEQTDQLFDIVFDCTGNKLSMEQSPARVAFGGTLVFVGLVNDKISLDDPLIHRRELTILASRNSANAFLELMYLMEVGRLDTSPWVTHRMKLEDVPERFPSVIREPGLLKAMVTI